MLVERFNLISTSSFMLGFLFYLFCSINWIRWLADTPDFHAYIFFKIESCNAFVWLLVTHTPCYITIFYHGHKNQLVSHDSGTMHQICFDRVWMFSRLTTVVDLDQSFKLQVYLRKKIALLFGLLLKVVKCVRMDLKEYWKRPLK